MSQELKAQAEQRGEVVGEIVGEFRDAGGWTPKIRWQCSGDHPGVGTKLYTAEDHARHSRRVDSLVGHEPGDET